MIAVLLLFCCFRYGCGDRNGFAAVVVVVRDDGSDGIMILMVLVVVVVVVEVMTIMMIMMINILLPLKNLFLSCASGSQP